MSAALHFRRRSEEEARADREAIGAEAKRLFDEYHARMSHVPRDYDALSPSQKDFWRDRAMDRICSGLK